MKRVFAAIDISEEVRETIRSYIDELPLGFGGVPVKWERAEKLHITVKFAGSVDQQQFDVFSEQIESIANSLGQFQMRISGTGAFAKRRGPSVLWLGTELASATGDPFAVLAGLSERRPFRPHLTIARIKHPRKARDPIEKHRASDFESAKFDVVELGIYESTLLPSGSAYSKLGSFPLRGQA